MPKKREFANKVLYELAYVLGHKLFQSIDPYKELYYEITLAHNKLSVYLYDFKDKKNGAKDYLILKLTDSPEPFEKGRLYLTLKNSRNIAYDIEESHLGRATYFLINEVSTNEFHDQTEFEDKILDIVDCLLDNLIGGRENEG